jgi:hypothetical protein
MPQKKNKKTNTNKSCRSFYRKLLNTKKTGIDSLKLQIKSDKKLQKEGWLV